MAKAKKTDERTATAADRAPKTLVQAASIRSNDIARHAYALSPARGGEHGHDVEDWLQAERDLRAVRVAVA